MAKAKEINDYGRIRQYIYENGREMYRDLDAKKTISNKEGKEEVRKYKSLMKKEELREQEEVREQEKPKNSEWEKMLKQYLSK